MCHPDSWGSFIPLWLKLVLRGFCCNYKLYSWNFVEHTVYSRAWRFTTDSRRDIQHSLPISQKKPLQPAPSMTFLTNCYYMYQCMRWHSNKYQFVYPRQLPVNSVLKNAFNAQSAKRFRGRRILHSDRVSVAFYMSLPTDENKSRSLYVLCPLLQG